MFVKSRRTGTTWIGLEQNIIDTAVNEWRKRLLALPCSHSGPTLQAILLQAVEK